MHIKKLSEEFSVSDQIQLADLQEISELGYHSIICNRPDGEGKEQPSVDQLRQAAEALNIEVRYIPVIPGKISADDVLDFTRAIEETANPTLAFCFTGTRSTKLWKLNQPGNEKSSCMVKNIARSLFKS